MVFLAEKIVPVPTQDILSWIFDEIPYDQDKPVSGEALDRHRSSPRRGLSTCIDIHRRHKARTFHLRQPSASDSQKTHCGFTKMGSEVWPEERRLRALVQ